MEFDVFRCRREGKLLPRHVMWGTKVRGDLYVVEEHDDELRRAVRVASVKDASHRDLIDPLRDAVVISAKPDWWTMTGWERITEGIVVASRAFQQSWILIPADKAP